MSHFIRILPFLLSNSSIVFALENLIFSILLVCRDPSLLGCHNSSRPLSLVLDEIVAWNNQPANQKEVIQLYLDDRVVPAHKKDLVGYYFSIHLDNSRLID